MPEQKHSHSATELEQEQEEEEEQRSARVHVRLSPGLGQRRPRRGGSVLEAAGQSVAAAGARQRMVQLSLARRLRCAVMPRRAGLITTV